MNFEPQDKVAVITGAAGGIGLGMARAFADAGMKVVIADIEADRLEATAANLRTAGYDALGVPTDVSRLDSVEALAAATMDTYGRVDVLCNNAGAAMFSTIAETTIEDWEWTVGLNLWGPIYGIKTFLPLIQRNTEPGHINSTASIAGLVAGGTVAPYNVTKHGVVALMATLERELRSAKSLHRASVLCPGPINTGIGRNSVRLRRAAGNAAVSRPVSGDDVATVDRAPGSATGQKLTDKMSSALGGGMDPDTVGKIVLDAIMNDRFWIFTHKKLLKHVREQYELMETSDLLSRGKLV
jgi:NAD(P)-dependent dehydrogenase (short-subunit alcohol dehydrogenase family)